MVSAHDNQCEDVVLIFIYIFFIDIICIVYHHLCLLATLSNCKMMTYKNRNLTKLPLLLKIGIPKRLHHVGRTCFIFLSSSYRFRFLISLMIIKVCQKWRNVHSSLDGTKIHRRYAGYTFRYLDIVCKI